MERVKYSSINSPESVNQSLNKSKELTTVQPKKKVFYKNLEQCSPPTGKVRRQLAMERR